ncbi:MAG: flagellar hook-length control protein FliK [Rhodospirillales bacterium]|nr:flagellar hook-length control protein FliK [Rhodospirillales bacterium]
MDVSAFYTRTAPGTSHAAIQAGAFSASNLSGAAGFLDFLLANLTQGQKINGSQEALTGTQDASGTGANASTEKGKTLSLEAFLNDLAAGLESGKYENIQDALTALLGDKQASADILAQLQTIQDQGTDTARSDIIAGLLNALLAPGQTPDAPAPLQSEKAGAESALASLLSANLTPEQIASLVHKISRAEETDNQTNAAFLAALLSQNQPAPVPEGKIAGPQDLSGNTVNLASPDDANGAAADAPALSLARTIARIVEENRTDRKETRNLRFADMLADGANLPASTAKITLATNAPGAALQTNSGTPKGSQPDTAALSGFSSEISGLSGVGTTLSPDSALTQWLERLTNPMSAQGPTATSPLPSAIGQSVMNGAHPASQIVAAAIIRTAQGGETKTVTLNLEPPDLGRVAVRMEMGKDRSIKTVLSVEKPEALALLQRDSHLLDRALQDAGFDAGSESVQFELAQDGGAFDQNRGNGSDGGYGGASGQSGEDSDAILIETRMDWFIDPYTGAQRYDLYV